MEGLIFGILRYWLIKSWSGIDLAIREFKQKRFWAVHVNRKWSIFPFNMPWRYQICTLKCLFSHKDDLPENLVNITPHVWNKSTSGWRFGRSKTSGSSTGSGDFLHFWVVILNKVLIKQSFSNKNLVPSTCIKRKKGSFPVDVWRQKRCCLNSLIPRVLTIYRNRPGRNLVHKHKTLQFEVVRERPATKFI